MFIRRRVPCNWYHRSWKRHRKRAILVRLGMLMSCLQSILTPSHFHHAFQEPELDIDCVALSAWERGQCTNAEALLSAAIPTSKKKRHHVLASRALVRARLERWDAALADAEEVRVAPLSHTRTLTPFRIKSIGIKRSFVGYVAKCVVLVGKGEKDEGIRVCDISFQHFHSEHVTLLRLIKVCDCARPWSSFDSSLFSLLSSSWPENMSMRYHA